MYSFSVILLFVVAQPLLVLSGPISSTGRLPPSHTASHWPLRNSTYGHASGSGATGYLTGTGYAAPTMIVTTTKSFHPESTHPANSSKAAHESEASASKSDEPTFASPSPALATSGSGTFPIYNINNVTCSSLTTMNASQAWAAVSGDQVLETLNTMFADNQLTCLECFGQSKGQCVSTDPACDSGLRDLATTNGQVRWDMAAARFSRDPDIMDLVCEIGSTECDAPPDCNSCDGPGAWAVLKSMETMHNTLESVWTAIGEARDNADLQMSQFASKFAPIPSIETESMLLGILTAVGCGMLGFLEGPAGIAMGMLAGVASGVVTENLFFSQPAPPDTASYLGTIANATQQMYMQVAQGLFENGSYVWTSSDGSKSTDLTMTDLMRGGALMEESADPSTFINALVPTYERVLLQQLLLFTWQNLEEDGVDHTPFIVFDNKPCDQVDPSATTSLQSAMFPGLNGLNSNITYAGKCYYLLDAKPIARVDTGRGGATGDYCSGNNALPGGTNEVMGDNSAIFAGLSLGDFIIPSVLGWQQNHNQNGYPLASNNGQLVSGPQDAGAVNLPVCDYLSNAEKPGVLCPMIGAPVTGKSCQTYSLSTGTNQAGQYNPGWCTLHVEQYQKNEGNENLLNSYQMSVTIYDADSREIGQATKQDAASPLLIVDTALPFDLIAVPGALDADPVRFWYSDQYWDSTSTANQCNMGAYDSGVRQGDCGFNCPFPNGDPPVSATIAHTLPTAAVTAVGGDTTFLNTFVTATPTPTAASPTTSSAKPTPTYATGTCGIHITQYQKNEQGENPTGNYLIEATLYDAKQNAIGTSGEVPAPSGTPVSVNGLVTPLTITAGGVDSAPLTISFNGVTFNTNSKQCSVGAYDSGNRNMDCTYSCPA